MSPRPYSVYDDSQSVAPANPGSGLEDFLVGLDEKLRQRSERLTQKLLAWGELLDVAGWCVALKLTGEDLWISENAERDLQRAGEVPNSWLELIGGIPAESIHHEGEGALIWSRRLVTSAVPEPVAILTRRESEIMSWLREGKTSPEIAIILGCAARTVEKHLANLYQKLGVRNRAAVILKVSKPIA